ncbi:MAG: NUDIX hydrolase [bacterium]
MSSSRIYPDRPILAVSAVVQNQDKEILIVRRAVEPGIGLWSLPGGVVKLGESVEQALRREIREECGIEVKIGELLGVFDRIFRDKAGKVKYHYIILDYRCYSENKDVRPGSDADDYHWLNESDLERFDYTPGVKELLKDFFKGEIS